MRLRQCQYFDALVQYGTIRAASVALFVSQPTISTQIKELEHELSISLLVRRGRGVELTEAGKLLAPLLRRVVNSAAAVITTAKELQNKSGPLRVGVVPSYAPVLVPLLVSLCTSCFPGISLDVVEDGSLALEHEVLEGSVDFAVVTRSAGINSDDSSLSITPLARGQLVAVMSSANVLAIKPDLNSVDLAGEQLFLYRSGYLVRSLIRRLLGDRMPRVFYTSDNNQTTRALIAQGLGVGFAITPEITELLQTEKDPRLVQVPITDAPLVELCCTYLTGRYLPNLLGNALAEATVNGQYKVPVGGQQKCPLVATETARSWPTDLPTRGLVGLAMKQSPGLVHRGDSFPGEGLGEPD